MEFMLAVIDENKTRNYLKNARKQFITAHFSFRSFV